MSIISDPPAQSVQGKQLTVALALGKILEHELPVADWHIGEILPGTLLGHVKDVARGASVEEFRQGMQAYAEFLNVEPVEEPDGENAQLVIRAIYRDVPVKVWGYIRLAEEKAEVPA